MAIFGLGAMYDGKDDVSQNFLSGGIACVGWSEADAPAAHNMLRHIKIGDIVFLKSFPPNFGLIVKAIGIVTGSEPREVENLGWGVDVRWLWQGERRIGRLEDKYDPMRGLTLYEEYNPTLQWQLIDLLLSQAEQASAAATGS